MAQSPESDSDEFSLDLAPPRPEHALSQRLEDLRLKDCHPQLQCPLFGVLPPELRNEIFLFSLAEYEDPDKPYPKESYYYRPGFRAQRRVDVALLQTCGRIWLETRALPARDLELPFWFGWPERRPPEYRLVHTSWNIHHEPLDQPWQAERYRKFDPQHWRGIRSIQFFPQLFALRADNINRFFLLQPYLRPSKLTITIRYADWCHREDNAALDFNWQGLLSQWRPFSDIMIPESINTIVLELESTEARRGQVQALVQDIVSHYKRWQFEKVGGSFLEIEGAREGVDKVRVKEWKWVGSTGFGGEGPRLQGAEIGYVVMALTWVPKRKDEEKRCGCALHVGRGAQWTT